MVLVEGADDSENVLPLRVTGARYLRVTNYNMYPDGSNKMPSLDTEARAGYVIVAANPNKTWKYVPLTTTNETTLWDPSSGTKFVLTDLIITANTDGECTFRDGTAGPTILHMMVKTAVPFSHSFTTHIESAAADNNLTAKASAANQYILVCGYEV